MKHIKFGCFSNWNFFLKSIVRNWHYNCHNPWIRLIPEVDLKKKRTRKEFIIVNAYESVEEFLCNEKKNFSKFTRILKKKKKTTKKSIQMFELSDRRHYGVYNNILGLSLMKLNLINCCFGKEVFFSNITKEFIFPRSKF